MQVLSICLVIMEYPHTAIIFPGSIARKLLKSTAEFFLSIFSLILAYGDFSNF